MITFENICKTFKTDLLTQPVKALDQVSFQIQEGSMVGFLGANGAGKTTSLKILLDFIRADSGRIIYGDSLGGSVQNAFKHIGFLPERPYFYPHLTGMEFAEFMGELSGISRKELKPRVQALSQRLKIDHALNRPLKTYSKGMLQRLGFLTVLQHNPKLIVLDEPLSGLDPVGRKELKELLREVNQQGTTIFFSSHVVPDVEESCDDVVFLKEGKLVYQGSVEEISKKYAKPSYIVKIAAKEFKPQAQILGKRILSGDILEVEVENTGLQSLLQEILGANIPLVAVEQTRMSLEEIFYHIRSRE